MLDQRGPETPANLDIRNQPTEYTVATNTAEGTTTTILIPTAVIPILKIGASPASVAMTY